MRYNIDPNLYREIADKYFEWMYNLVCGERYARQISFRKLLMRLHDTEFTYLMDRDENRAKEGIFLRYRFSLIYGYEDALEYLDGPCSVLEMILALAIHCEENIMDDPAMGDRTRQWFWGMIVNLGLGSMMDENFDRQYVEETVERFLNRDYEPNGKGGLFFIRDCKYDLREVEIWYQLNYYLNTIT